ncbi:monocarboxylate transporter 7 [Eurosta solidaginis]|uniref:monocarboxylate transporter 7 n=1 Tax=Eurosta solidaginis TaxID=178769 RepID=UPI00353118BA
MKTPTKLDAPDGGWGICICIGMAFPLISGLGALTSFGLLFGDFLKSVGAEASAVALTTSAFFCATSFAGLFSGSLFARFSIRAIALLGAFLYFFGSLIQIIAQSTWQLLLAFSVFQGIGFGLMVPASYTKFNHYFIKKRVMWMSFAQALIGLGTMFYPVVIQMLLNRYGFRGCLLVLAAINAHPILGMLLMQPVEWHMKKVQDEVDQEMVGLNKMYIDKEKEIVMVPIKDYTQTSAAKATTDVDSALSTEQLNTLTPLKESRRVSQQISREGLATRSRRSSSLTNIGNWSGPIPVSNASMVISRVHSTLIVNEAGAKIEKQRGCWQAVVDFLDLTLLKQPVYVNIVLGISFALYSDIAFFTIQPLYLFELGFTKPETASIIAIGAAADLASRIFLAFSTAFIQMPSRYIYLAGAFFTVICRFAFLNVFSFIDMACTTAVMGFLRTWVHVPLPLVFAEYLHKKRFATGYGLFMFLQGNIMFAIGPVVGYLQDQTKDYIITFHCLNFFMALCAVSWLIEMFCLKFRRK